MRSWGGARTLRLPQWKGGESTPRWSPDGRWLAFLSGREDEHSQLWLLDRSGGEGRKLTTFAGDVEDYVWAPDGKRLAAAVGDGRPAEAQTAPPPPRGPFPVQQGQS